MTNKSSRRWLKEHFNDTYVKQAQRAGYRSRAVYKLQEIQERYHLFKPGMTIIDLGAAPGGWSQVLAQLVRPNGRVIAVDLLPMDPIPGVQFIQGDFANPEILKQMTDLINNKVDWVVSDMSPNLSGNESIDIPRSIYLNELTLNFALDVLIPKGGLFLKAFQGEGFDDLLQEIKHHFESVTISKPKASRGRSREVYILARLRN